MIRFAGNLRSVSRIIDTSRCTEFQIIKMKEINAGACVHTVAQQTCAASLSVSVDVLNNKTDAITYAWSATTAGGTNAFIGDTTKSIIEMMITAAADATTTVTCTATETATGFTSTHSIDVKTTHTEI